MEDLFDLDAEFDNAFGIPKKEAPVQQSKKPVKGNFIIKDEVVVFELDELGAFSLNDPNELTEVVKDLLDRKFPARYYFGIGTELLYMGVHPKPLNATVQEREAIVAGIESMSEEEKQRRQEMRLPVDKPEEFRNRPLMPDECIDPNIVFSEITPESFDGPEKDIDDVDLYFSSGAYEQQMEIANEQLAKHPDYTHLPLGQKEAQEMNRVRDHGLGIFSKDADPMIQAIVVENIKNSISDDEKENLKKILFPIPSELKIEEGKGFVPEEDYGQPDLFAMEEALPDQSFVAGSDGKIEMTIEQAHAFNIPTLLQREQELLEFDIEPNVETEIYTKYSVKMVVLGEPSSQKRHRHSQPKGMKFVMTYDPSAADKKDFLSIIQSNAPKVPLDCPLKMEVDLYFSRPKSHFNSKGEVKPSSPTWKASGKDLDNCVKYIQDSMNKVFYRDDTLICELTVTKKYDLNPRTEIVLSVL